MLLGTDKGDRDMTDPMENFIPEADVLPELNDF